MGYRIQNRRDTAERWAEVNPILLEGEVGYVTDNPNQHKIGDGIHRWNDLPLRGYTGTIAQELGNDENAVVSQKAVTEKVAELNSEIDEFKDSITNQVNNYKPIVVNGNVTNAADEEDITSANNLLKLKDRNNLDGMGHIILRKNKTFTEQLTQTNTIYEIRYNFDLNGEEVTIPEGCVLEFQGGGLNNGSVIGNNTTLNSDKTKIFDLSVILKGNWNLGEVYPEWFGANRNSNGKEWVDCIIKSISLLSQYGGTVKLNGHIPISSSIDLRPYRAVCLEGTFTNLVNPGQGYNTVIIKNGDFDAVILGSWCSMRNIGVSSSATNDSHDGVWVTGFGCILDNVGVNDQGGNGIKVGNKPIDVDSGDYLTDCCKFYNVKSIHNEGYGLVISDEQITDPNTSDANANTFYSLDIRDNKMGGIYIDKCIDNTFINLATQVNGSRASEKPLADIYIGSKARGHYFYSPYCESHTEYGIYLEKGASDNCIYGHRSGTIDSTYFDANEEDGWNAGGYNYIQTIKGSMWRGAYVPSFVNFENLNIVNKEWKGGTVNLVLTNDGIFKINSSSVKQFDVPKKIVIKKQNTTDVVLDNISGALYTERFDAESMKAKQGLIVKNDRITNVRIRAYLKSAKKTLTAQSTTNVIVTSNVNNISNGAYVIARLRSGEIPSGVFYNVQCTADNEVTFSFVNVTNSDISLPELQWDILALEGQIIV